ncbi:MAG: hypothetical protein C4567_00500 [Deltaproteobacteria bacterium]|nr:MAG: hypothetical protein C4567_00500 [Deltaproteobacteria bacterium]
MRHKDVKAIFSEFDAYCQALDRNGCISYPVTITWSMTGQQYGRPVVVILGEAREAGDLPPGELQVPAEILEEMKQVGYGAQPLSLEEIKEYWREARRLIVKDHWHPEARLVQY